MYYNYYYYFLGLGLGLGVRVRVERLDITRTECREFLQKQGNYKTHQKNCQINPFSTLHSSVSSGIQVQSASSLHLG